MKLFGANAIGIGGAFTVLLGQLVIFFALLDKVRLWDFLKGSASNWIQAVGSIAAILASYKMGEMAFRKQVHKEDIADLQAKIHAYQVLEEVFQTVSAVSYLSSHVTENPLAKQIKASAQDTLQMINAVPSLDVPHPDLVRRLALSRQAMLSYIGWSEGWLIKEEIPILTAWSSFAKTSLGDSEDSIAFCAREARRLEKRAATLKLKL